MGIAETATRETFANLPTWAIAFWYFLIVVSVCVFAWGVYRLVRKYRRGRGEDPCATGAPERGEQLVVVEMDTPR